MRNRSIDFIVLVIILGSSVTAVKAQSNHSLERGIYEGEEFVYVLQRKLILDSAREELVTQQIPLVQQLGE